MYNLKKIIFSQCIIVILTVVNVNYVTEADLIEVDKHCLNHIKTFFMKCNDCTTITKQIKFILLHTVPDDLISRKNEIAREYTKHLYQAVTWRRFKSPTEFCADFVLLNSFMMDTVAGCLEKLQHHAPEIFTGYESSFYFQLSLDKDYPMYYVTHYIEDVQKAYDIEEMELKGINTPELFCDMKRCDYEIKFDIPGTIRDEIIRSTMYAKTILLQANYDNFHHDLSKQYVDYAYKLIDEDATLTLMMSPNEYCDHFIPKDNYKICIDTIKKHKWNTFTTKKQFFKHMFYYLTEDNTTKVNIGAVTKKLVKGDAFLL